MKEKIKVAVEEYLGNKDNIARAMAGCPVLSSIKKRASGDVQEYQEFINAIYVFSRDFEDITRSLERAVGEIMREIEYALTTKAIVGTLTESRKIELSLDGLSQDEILDSIEHEFTTQEVPGEFLLESFDYETGTIIADLYGGDSPSRCQVTIRPSSPLLVPDDLDSVELVFTGDGLVNLVVVREQTDEYFSVLLKTEVALVNIH